MAKQKDKKETPTRNVAFYKDDFDWFSRAAEYANRSRVRMMRHCISKWKEGEPVLLTVDMSGNGKAGK
jgi:hypothetical protein